MEAEEANEVSLLLSAHGQRHESLDEGGGGDLVLIEYRADLLAPGLSRRDSAEAGHRAPRYSSRRLATGGDGGGRHCALVGGGGGGEGGRW